jgi:O-antigen/teichoic acid export membrane protein
VREILRQIRLVARLRPFDTSTPEGRSSERYRRIVLTTATAMAARAIGALIGLVTVPLLLSFLGKERFGLWTAITTLVTWATLFDFGLSNGLVNLVSRAHGRQDEEEARQVFSTAFLALSVVAAVLGVAAVVAVPLVPWSRLLAARGVADEVTVRWSVTAALAAFLVSLPLAAVSQLYAGYQKSYVTNALGLVGSVAGLGLLVAAVRADATMPVLVLCLSAMGLVAPLLALVLARRALPWIRIRARHASRAALQALTARSVPIFLYQLGALAVNETQVILLARRADLATVADYSIVLRVYLVIISLIQLGTASFVPTFREAYERGDRAWALRAFRHLQRLRMALALAGGVGMMLLGNWLLRVWLHREDVRFGPGAWAALAALLLGAVWGTAYVEFLWIMDRLWPLVTLVLANGAVTVALTWVLAPAHGVQGALVASAAFTLAISSWVLPVLARPLLVPEGPAR